MKVLRAIGAFVVVVALVAATPLINLANQGVLADGVDTPTEPVGGEDGKVRTPEDLKNAVDKKVSVITLEDNLDVTSLPILNIARDTEVQLNGHTIKSNKRVFYVKGVSLTISGNGVIEATNTTTAYSTIGLHGDNNKTSVTIKYGSTIKAGGIMYALGVIGGKANQDIYIRVKNGAQIIGDSFDKNLNAKGYTGGNGISVNGLVESVPRIDIDSGAKISTPTGTAIYAAGDATWNIDANIESAYAIGIKSGSMVFNSARVHTTSTEQVEGADTLMSNGMKLYGSVFQIEHNKSYAGYNGEINLTINGGEYASDNGYIFEEYGEKDTYANIVIGANSKFTAGPSILRETLGEKSGITIIGASTFTANDIAEGNITFPADQATVAEGFKVCVEGHTASIIASEYCPGENQPDDGEGTEQEKPGTCDPEKDEGCESTGGDDDKTCTDDNCDNQGGDGGDNTCTDGSDDCDDDGGDQDDNKGDNSDDDKNEDNTGTGGGSNANNGAGEENNANNTNKGQATVGDGSGTVFVKGNFGNDKVKVTIARANQTIAAFADAGKNYATYDINLLDVNTNLKYNFNGTVTVSLKVPVGIDGSKASIYYIKPDYTIGEKLASTYKDGMISFDTTHFSLYAIVEDGGTNLGNFTTPDTGFLANLGGNATLAATGAVSAGAVGMGVLVYRGVRRRAKRN